MDRNIHIWLHLFLHYLNYSFHFIGSFVKNIYIIFDHFIDFLLNLSKNSNLEFITDYFGIFVGMMTTFGSAFLTFTYLCGFLFEKSDSAYKGFPLLNYFVFYSIPYAILGICREYQTVCYITEIIFFITSPIFTLNRGKIKNKNILIWF